MKEYSISVVYYVGVNTVINRDRRRKREPLKISGLVLPPASVVSWGGGRYLLKFSGWVWPTDEHSRSEFRKGIADLPSLLSWLQGRRRGSMWRKKHEIILFCRIVSKSDFLYVFLLFYQDFSLDLSKTFEPNWLWTCDMPIWDSFSRPTKWSF